MTGPEHYREAEKHIGYAQNAGDHPATELAHLNYAQVHATLALAAATAITSYQAAEDWETAAGQGKP